MDTDACPSISETTLDGNTRRYSDNDLAQIAQVAELSQTGVNAQGIRQVLELERAVAALETEVADLHERLAALEREVPRARGQTPPQHERHD